MVQISSECLRAIKDFIADIEGYAIGRALEDAWLFAMENIDDFEDYVEIEDVDADEGESGEDWEEEEALDPEFVDVKHGEKVKGGWY